MRELKFRLFDKIDERYQGEDEYLGLTPDGESFIYIDETGEFEFLGTDDFIIEQYTGLKDKNGKEIYEGDIVNMPSSECAVVDYDAGSFTLNCSHCSATWTMDRWCFELGLHLDNICTTVEVIGNVHENKELLK